MGPRLKSAEFSKKKKAKIFFVNNKFSPLPPNERKRDVPKFSKELHGINLLGFSPRVPVKKKMEKKELKNHYTNPPQFCPPNKTVFFFWPPGGIYLGPPV